MEDPLVIIGDCRKELRKLPKKSVRLAVTSPPYNLRKEYNNYIDNIHIEEWKSLISDTLELVREVLTDDGSFFLNVSPIPDKKTKEIIPLDSIAWLLAKEKGFYLRNKIIWHFNNMQNCSIRLSGRWEAVLWLVKDIKHYVFNLEEVKIPVLTQNDKRFGPDATRNPTDVWYFNRVNNMTKAKLGITEHPCVYPEEMITRIVKMASKPGDIILDPFAGTGTTLLVAKRLNRKSIGIEVDRSYEKLIHKRLNEEVLLPKGKEKIKKANTNKRKPVKSFEGDEEKIENDPSTLKKASLDSYQNGL